MKGYSSKDIIKLLINDGWIEFKNTTDSHHTFKHSIKNANAKVTVLYPKKDLPIGTVKNIIKQAQINI